MAIGDPQAEYAGYKHVELTQRIIGVFYDVYNTLGWGFLEKVYENALVLRLRSCGLRVEQQRRISVYFYEVGLLMNFGPKPKVTRKAFDNSYKANLKSKS